MLESSLEFETQKKNSSKKKFVNFFEILLITFVVLGTALWLLISSHFSFQTLFANALRTLTPQVSTEKKTAPQIPEETVKKLLNGTLEVTSTSRTEDGSLQVATKNNLVIIFSLKKDLAGQVRSLQTILAKAKIDNKTIQKVDFRFSKTIIQ